MQDRHNDPHHLPRSGTVAAVERDCGRRQLNWPSAGQTVTVPHLPQLGTCRSRLSLPRQDSRIARLGLFPFLRVVPAPGGR